jgi:hypothetical protein
MHCDRRCGRLSRHLQNWCAPGEDALHRSCLASGRDLFLPQSAAFETTAFSQVGFLVSTHDEPHREPHPDDQSTRISPYRCNYT